VTAHEPRCHQNGMDARRRDAAKAGRLGKERNDADVRFGEPAGSGLRTPQRVVASSWCVSTHGVLRA
jgi:hypothetical protein